MRLSMPTFQVHVINTDFSTRADIDRPTRDQARKEALQSALQIGVEEVCNGRHFFGAEVRIERDDEVVERLLVAVGVSSLR
jgi:hypothetical protein